MNNVVKFKKLREKYPIIIYDSYSIDYNENSIFIVYDFKIPGLSEFHPSLEIEIKNRGAFEKTYVEQLVFNIGMIELISYFKCTCSPHIKINAGSLSEEQQNWFRKLYYLGLGEMLYNNGIVIDENELLSFEVDNNVKEIFDVNFVGNGNLIAIGGGKDSCVSLELLKKYDNYCVIMNVNLECAMEAGYNENNIIKVYRKIDNNLIELNNKGFLNGHTPFSAVLAFILYLAAYLNKKKYIILSNEASANEPTIPGTKINHQYSKTYEFENDFNNYCNKFFKSDIKYFSLLRPLSELQIALLFSNYKKYHHIFKSCNVGSKQKEWKWCCNCAKCLFVYIILSPFLSKEELIEIFGEDLYEKEELLDYFLELSGYREKKPFECVGSIEEVRYCICVAIEKYKNNLPFLLDYYNKNCSIDCDKNLLKKYNSNHNLDDDFEKIIKEELNKYVS